MDMMNLELVLDIPDSVVQGKEPTIIQEGIVTPTVTLVTRWTTVEDTDTLNIALNKTV